MNERNQPQIETEQQEGDSLSAVNRRNKVAAASAPVTPPKSRWQKAVDYFGISSEVSNVGIVVTIIAKIPGLAAVLTVGGGAFAYLAFITDPLIYCFKSLIRLTRVIGREAFGVKFEEEKHGTHKYQTAADLASLSLFAIAIPLFVGAIIASPIGLTLAWTCALAGLCIVGYFDYYLQSKMAEKHWKDSCRTNGDKHPDSLHAHKDFIDKQNSTRLFVALLIGLSFLLICGSAAVFAPPALVPILLIASKVASAYLGTIACLRFFNWLRSGPKKEEPALSNASTVTPSVTSTPLAAIALLVNFFLAAVAGLRFFNWLRSGSNKKDKKAIENANTASPDLTSAPQSTTALTKTLMADNSLTATRVTAETTPIISTTASEHPHLLFRSSSAAMSVDEVVPRAEAPPSVQPTAAA